MRLEDGTIDIGKLTMHHVDLIMVDLPDDARFDLDLNNYQEQLVNGYTRMPLEAGLQILRRRNTDSASLSCCLELLQKPDHEEGQKNGGNQRQVSMSEYFLVHASLQIRQVQRNCLGDGTFHKKAECSHDDDWQRRQACSHQNRWLSRPQIGYAKVNKRVERERKYHQDHSEVATLPTGYDDPWERYGEKNEKEKKNQGEKCHSDRRIRKPNDYPGAWRRRQSGSWSAHSDATFANRSNKTSTTNATLNTRNAKFLESRHVLSELQAVPVDCRQ